MNIQTYKIQDAPISNTSAFTQIIFAQSKQMPEDGRNWTSCDDDTFELELEFEYECVHLFTQNSVRYFGWM